MTSAVPRKKPIKNLRRWLINMSIQRKITLIIVAVTLIAVALTTASFMVYDNIVAKRQLAVRMTTLADMIGDNCLAALTFMDPDDAERTLKSLDADANIEEAAVWDAQNNLFALYQRNKGARVPILGLDGHYFTKTHLTVTRTLQFSGGIVGRIMIRSNLQHLVSRQRQYSAIAFLLAMLSLGIATLLAAKYQRIISNPIVSLAEVARGVTESRDYSVRAHRLGNDEVGLLIESFNNMLSEIQRRDSDLLRAQVALQERAVELQLELTERQRAEQEAARMQAFLQNVIDSMPSVLVSVDTQYRVTQWNLRAEQVTGVSREAALGQNVSNVFPICDESCNSIESAIATRQPQKRERVPMPLGDDGRVVDVTIYPLVTTSVQGVVLRVDDITDRVRMEELMTQTEKMMSVGGLAAGMAHEINNPLGIILQSAQNIKRRTSGDVAKNHEVARRVNISLDVLAQYMEERGIFEFLKDIDDAGKRAAAIVSNMLNFSRRTESERSSAKIEDLLDTSVQLAANDYDLKKKYDFRTIEIVRDYGDGVPPVPCIVTKLEQVFLNLLKNAAHALAEFHAGDRPRITLRTRLQKNNVRIEIEDNGPGIPEDVRRRVFEPFFTTKEVGTGTGLGLSVSFFIVADNHGGTIEVESEPAQGARFIITLPLNQA